MVCTGRCPFTFSIKHLWDVQELFCHLEGSVQVSNGVILQRDTSSRWLMEHKRELTFVSMYTFLGGETRVLQDNYQPAQRRNKEKSVENRGRKTEHLPQFGVVDEVGSVSVDESTQSQAVLPTEPQGKDWKHQRQEGRLRGGEK